MNLLASLNTQIGKLVHPAIHGKSLDFNRHRNFLATRLAVSLGALVAAPLCLACSDAPAWWEAGALAWLLLPAAGAASVSRSGKLAVGEALSLAAWIGLCVTLAVGSGSATGLGLLFLVPMEAVLTGRTISKAGLIAMAVAAAAAVLVPIFLSLGATHPSGSPIVRFGTGITTAAELYGVVLAWLAARLHQRQNREERVVLDRYRDVVATMEDALLCLDRSGMVLEAGDVTQRLFGINGRDLLGRGLFDRVHVADRPAFLTLIADAATGGACRTAVVRLRTGTTLPSHKGAFREPVFARAELRTRRRDGAGLKREDATILCLMRDVTERHRLAAALEDAELAVSRSEAGRTLFLAHIGHELRTPLNAIIGFADLLASETLGPKQPAKQQEYASIIFRSGQHLVAVVSSILDAAKIEAGSFSIQPEPFRLSALVHECCDMIELQAEAGAVELCRDLGSAMPEVVGDARGYKQILINLLSNAVKFTPAGGRVTISAKPQGTSIILAVADTGIGIEAGDLPKLGAPFYQARNAFNRALDGTGLGLSVVRGLVGLHGGSMIIESAPGHGTRVLVRLPSDCRCHPPSSATDTKIETISRYGALTQCAAGQTALARIHKRA